MALCPINLLAVRKFASLSLAYTGAGQDIVVPPGATVMVFDITGAQGANSQGGLGGRVQGAIPVTPGETLHVNVGGQGQVPTGGFNGGANGSVNGDGTNGWGGGGATDIRRGGTALANRILVAGAGGGAINTVPGGAGGGLTGADGSGQNGSFPNSNGKGGTQLAGGAGGTVPTPGTTGWPAGSGGLGLGGVGPAYGGPFVSPGGGGGYYGGGGGAIAFGLGTGTGAGGSSYTDPSATSVVHTQGNQAGNGHAKLSFR